LEFDATHRAEAKVRLEIRHSSPPPKGTRVLLETVENGRLYRLSLVTEVSLRNT
jgi:hypothetical protein